MKIRLGLKGKKPFNFTLALAVLVCVLALIMPLASYALDLAAPVADAGKFDERAAQALASSPESVPVIVTTHGTPNRAADRARKLGGKVTWEYDIIDGFAAKMQPAALNVMAARADVEKIYLDRKVAPVMDFSHRAIEADKAWAAGHDGAGVTVAVIDTGIDPVHPFFTGAVVSCVSTIGGLVSPECADSDGHGTHVAGTVASRDARYPGVARGASLAVVRVLHAVGAGLSSDIIAGMNWVGLNKDTVSPRIRVATMSIGLLDPGCGDNNNPEAKAANALVDRGVFFSVAAGNSGHKSCTIDGASAAANVTTIAAVDDKETVTQGDDVIAGFSSGGSSKNNKPDVSFPGVDITSAFLGAGLLIATMDGTSMATPHAAGTAALLAQAQPTLTAKQIKDRITGNAVKTSNTGNSFNYVYGHGLGNACRALQLNTCGEAAASPATSVHVSNISMSYTHTEKNNAHLISSAITVVDSVGKPVNAASVSARFTSPEGNQYSKSGTTGSNGVAILSAKQSRGGHGTWNLCVTGVSGTGLSYDSAANAETCDSIWVA